MNHRSVLSLAILLLAISVQAAPRVTRFQLREPHLRGYTLESRPAARSSNQSAAGYEPEQWVTAHPDNDAERTVELGSRLLVKIKPGKNINDVVGNGRLQLVRALDGTSFLFQAADAMTALAEADCLSQTPEVSVCVPVMRRPLELHAFVPNDPYFSQQWNLANSTNGASLNMASAWNVTRGKGSTMAIVDDGVEISHPDLSSRTTGMPHHNFIYTNNNGAPVSDFVSVDQRKVLAHGTAVAGMAAATATNSIGIVGVAPESKFASWVIFATNAAGLEIPADSEQLMAMFQYNVNGVAIQNHSWGNEKTEGQEPIDPFAEIGLQKAIESGRGGRGVIMVRSVGNYRYWIDSSPGGQIGRTILANADDDGYPSDRRVISVAAVNATGRVTRYSNPGACILVAAPATEWRAKDDNSADLNFPSLFMLDRPGAKGYNTNASPIGDYVFSNSVPVGTSFAAPQIAGLAALLLSVNTNLTYRDVQQIMIRAARHFDFADPDVMTNGAGLVVSHNVGFGVPDATVAVNLAKTWVPCPPLRSVSLTNDTPRAVEDDGLHVIVSNGTETVGVLAASPTTGIQADEPTEVLPMVDVGQAVTVPEVDLTGKAALIQRGGATFAVKIQNVAQAGAKFAVIYNNSGSRERLLYTINTNVTLPMTDTDFAPIPAVFIDKQDGDALRDYNTTNETYVQLNLASTDYTFTVTNQLSCEHVSVEVDGDNITSPDSRRGDLRITLVSPSGTRSVLQKLNTDTSRVTSPAWVYNTTHHFFEESAGTWMVSITDEAPGATATIRSVVLRIYGTEPDHGHRGDIDGNGASDLLFQLSGNKLMTWLMKPDGTNFLKSINLPTPAVGWRAAAVADFNHDGKDDILFQHSNGKMGMWYMNGTNRLTSIQLVRNGTPAAAGWKVVAAADFNRDGRPDALLQHTSGKLVVWFLNGTNFLGSAALKAPAAGWYVVGAADFSLDGYSDILFRSAAGKFALWSMKGTTQLSSETLVKVAAYPWVARGVTDFNKDGRPDILFQNSTSGALAVWCMNGKTFRNSVSVNKGKAIAPWQLVGPR